MDLSGLIAVADTAPIGALVVAVGALVIVPLVAVFGVRVIMRMIGDPSDDESLPGADDDQDSDWDRY